MMGKIGEVLRPKTKEQSLRLAVISTGLSLAPTAYATVGSHSIVLFGDLLRCLVEFGAIFVSWIIIRRAARPGAYNYFDYGRGKLEHVASLGVAGALFLSFLVVLICAVHRINNPTPVADVTFGLVLGILSVGGNLYLWFENRAIARRESSPIVDSQARLFLTKAMASIVVSVSLMISVMAAGSSLALYADPVGSLLLSGFILYAAIGLVSTSMNDLLDRSIEEAYRLAVLKILVEYEAAYVGLGHIRSRRAGGKSYIEIALGFSGHQPFADIGVHIEKIRSEIAGRISGSEVTIVPYVA